MGWSIRSYNAFLREVKAEHGLTYGQAQAVYRRVSDRLDRPAYGVDVARHPRITGQEVRRTVRPLKRVKPVRPKRPRKPAPKRPGKPAPKRPADLAKGTELELTYTTRGHTPRRRRGGGGRLVDKRPLGLKIRARAMRPMSREGLSRRVKRASETAVVPEGIELLYVDWYKGRGHEAKSGAYTGVEMLDALVSFRRAMKHDRASVRDEIVKGEG